MKARGKITQTKIVTVSYRIGEQPWRSFSQPTRLSRFDTCWKQQLEIK